MNTPALAQVGPDLLEASCGCVGARYEQTGKFTYINVRMPCAGTHRTHLERVAPGVIVPFRSAEVHEHVEGLW